ncbi:hypothetical protein EJB05_56389, partial [Eragrostis curvula]
MAIKVFKLVVLGLVVIMLTTRTTIGEQDCQKEKSLVKHVCEGSIKIRGPYVPPTAPCRRAVEALEASDMLCICRKFTHLDEITISMTKFVELARDCNKPLPAGTKCGSKLGTAAATIKSVITTGVYEEWHPVYQ